jgi:hypothetical protein
MTLPSDNQQANDDAEVDGPAHPDYEILGRFQPRDAKRILKQLEEQHLSFEVNEVSGRLGLYTVWPFYRSCLCIYVRPEDRKKAEAISDENSARSRAAAGIRYLAVGGIICAAAILQMRSGVLSIPYRDGRPMPLEFVAGIAGIVVFMGILQLVIAVILELRQRRRSHLLQPRHLTNR